MSGVQCGFDSQSISLFHTAVGAYKNNLFIIKIEIIIVLIILYIILTLHPLVQSRIRTLQRTVPSQTEVTDLNCSDHSTTPKRNGRLSIFGVHPSDMDSGSDSMIHYGVILSLQP